MKLKSLIKIVSKNYPDKLVENAFETGKPVGDGLAEFIAREIEDTFEPGATSREQIAEANRAMTYALEELQSVVNALEEYWNNKYEQKKG